MGTSTIEFLILGFNGQEESIRCIDSILLHEPNAGIIFLDNGSTESMQNVQLALAANQEKYIFLRSDTNMGVAGGRNILLRESKAEILIIIDNDASLLRPVTKLVLNYLLPSPKLGIIGFEGILLDPEMKDYTYREVDLEVDAVSGYFQCFRRSLYEQLGDISEYMLYGKEDIDYSLRVKALGYTNMIYKSLEVHHIRHVSSSTLDPDLKIKAESQNEQLFKGKWLLQKELFEYNRKHLDRLECVECDEIWVRQSKE